MNIKISKNAHTCAACEGNFAHEQTLISTVRVLEGALQRKDFCSDCWAAQENKKAYSIWETIYIDPKVKDEQPPEIFSPLRQLFYDAATQESRIEMATAFLAAGLLRRQKVFRRIKESDESDGEVRITLYTDRIGNRLIEVPDPQFTYAEMEEARNILLARLQELEKEEEEPESAESAEFDDESQLDADSDDPSSLDAASTYPDEETAHAQA
ncbi:MAG: hypothetical protein L3K26_09435 [Candidatus Hydrogenedentes bacterium]|nr:hypothetical protein [Candidatus Hydrogenedentota bacterium]